VAREFKYIDGTAERTYIGFWGAFPRTNAMPQVMAIATVDGEPELWGLEHDNPEQTAFAVSELRRYYRETSTPQVRIAIYDRRATIIEKP
jgi:hypothetical protein